MKELLEEWGRRVGSFANFIWIRDTGSSERYILDNAVWFWASELKTLLTPKEGVAFVIYIETLRENQTKLASHWAEQRASLGVEPNGILPWFDVPLLERRLWEKSPAGVAWAEKKAQ